MAGERTGEVTNKLRVCYASHWLVRYIPLRKNISIILMDLKICLASILAPKWILFVSYAKMDCTCFYTPKWILVISLDQNELYTLQGLNGEEDDG